MAVIITSEETDKGELDDMLYLCRLHLELQMRQVLIEAAMTQLRLLLYEQNIQQ